MADGEQAMERDIERVRERSMQVLARLLPHVAGAGADAAPPLPDEVVHHWQHSNDLLEVRLGGRRLMIKRGVEPWAHDRFRSSSIAASLLREAGIRAPEHLGASDLAGEDPVLTWWRLPGPTLKRAWPGLDPAGRRRALADLGRLLRRIHAIPVPSWGPLWRGGEPDVDRPSPETAQDFFTEDLAQRLRPALAGHRPDARAMVDRLLDQLGRLPLAADRPVLVHHDPHFSNILCERDGPGVRCTGVLDLEAAAGGVPESDFAYLWTVHSPLLAGHPDDADAGCWEGEVLKGYDAPLRPAVLAFFRAYHLLNLGFHAALTGYQGHADAVFAAARDAVTT